MKTPEQKKKNAERSKKWRDAHPGYMKEYMKKYTPEHIENMRAADRKYHADHREEKNAARKAWGEKYPEREAETYRRWYRENRDRVRDTRFRAKYGITLADYNAMLLQQNSKCKICFSTEPKGFGRFHVDHDHKTGKVRGLLCSHCNVGLGHFKENAALLRDAASYVETKGMDMIHTYVPDLAAENSAT